jgi:putative oxidoreductase
MKMNKKWVRVLGWAVMGLVSLFFIQAGFQKLAGTEMMVTLFRDLGYPSWFMAAVGLFEIAGAVLLLIPRTSHFAAVAISALMIGAAVSEMSAGRAFQALIPLQWLIVTAIIFYFRRRVRRRLSDPATDAAT